MNILHFVYKYALNRKKSARLLIYPKLKPTLTLTMTTIKYFSLLGQRILFDRVYFNSCHNHLIPPRVLDPPLNQNKMLYSKKEKPLDSFY